MEEAEVPAYPIFGSQTITPGVPTSKLKITLLELSCSPPEQLQSPPSLLLQLPPSLLLHPPSLFLSTSTSVASLEATRLEAMTLTLTPLTVAYSTQVKKAELPKEICLSSFAIPSLSSSDSSLVSLSVSETTLTSRASLCPVALSLLRVTEILAEFGLTRTPSFIFL
jgi:hypothetical protein